MLVTYCTVYNMVIHASIGYSCDLCLVVRMRSICLILYKRVVRAKNELFKCEPRVEQRAVLLLLQPVSFIIIMCLYSYVMFLLCYCAGMLQGPKTVLEELFYSQYYMKSCCTIVTCFFHYLCLSLTHCVGVSSVSVDATMSGSRTFSTKLATYPELD